MLRTQSFKFHILSYQMSVSTDGVQSVRSFTPWVSNDGSSMVADKAIIIAATVQVMDNNCIQYVAR